MYLKELSLKNFRNYESARLLFASGVNYLIGSNAQGKSNLIEAIYYLSTGRSFRTNRIGNLVRHGCSSFRIKAVVGEGEGVSTIDISYGAKGVSLTIDGRRARKMGALIGLLNTIIFSPEDLYIVKGSPYLRRRFLDILISQLHRPYLVELARYGRVIRQRNEALRRGEREITHWNSQIIASGLGVMNARSGYLERLAPNVQEAYSAIRPGERLELAYDSIYRTLGREKERAYEEALEATRDSERRKGYTLVGPHRDDLLITIGGRDARHYASDGQRRAVVVALKYAQSRLSKEMTGRVPLLLIDDPLAELDVVRRGAVMPFFSNGFQCIITSTSEEGLLPGKRFGVREGRVRETE